MHESNLDLNGNFGFTRKSFQDFMEKMYGLKLNHFMLTEAILACRGPEIDNSDTKTSYHLDKLIEWMQKYVPSIQSLDNMT